MDNPENNGRFSGGATIGFDTKTTVTCLAFVIFLRILFIGQIIIRRLSRSRDEAAGGLNPRILETLPVVVIGEDAKEVFKDGLECTVCLNEFCDGERARILPKCQHGYHADCIDMWFQSHSNCPLCRSPVDANGNGVQADHASSLVHNETSLLPASSASMAAVAAEESSMAASSGGWPEGVSVIDIPKQTMDEEKEKEQDQAVAVVVVVPAEGLLTAAGSDGFLVIDIPRETVDEEKVEEEDQKVRSNLDMEY